VYLEHHPEIELHQYFHHLNSSQAFALNLFFPYFEGPPGRSRILLRALGQEGTLQERHWKLEDVPDKAEESNIDVTWMTASMTRTLCEVSSPKRPLERPSTMSGISTSFADYMSHACEIVLILSCCSRSSFFRTTRFYGTCGT
jgi:hypothetical protein